MKYVVDTGKVKQKFGNALKLVDISQSMGAQRAGRAGRVSAGYVYRLMPEETFFKKLSQHSLPEIVRSDLIQFSLETKMLDGPDRRLTKLFGKQLTQPFGASDLPLPSSPPKESIQQAEDLLCKLNFITARKTTMELTQRGTLASILPLPALWANVILESIELDCMEEIVTIVAMASQECVWFSPHNNSHKTELARKRLMEPTSDHLSLLQLFNAWKKVSSCYPR